MIKFGLGLGDPFSAEIIRLVGKLLGTEKSQRPLRSYILPKQVLISLSHSEYVYQS